MKEKIIWFVLLLMACNLDSFVIYFFKSKFLISTNLLTKNNNKGMAGDHHNKI